MSIKLLTSLWTGNFYPLRMRVLIGVCLLSITGQALAIEPVFPSQADLELMRSGTVRRIGPYTEIDDKTIFAVIQDKQGFVWVGTVFGLYRFDGVDFIEYTEKFNRPANRQERLIYNIIEDSRGILWFGTHHDLYRYDRERDDIVKMHGPGSSRIVCEDPQGRIYTINQDSQLSAFTFDGNELTPFESPFLKQLAQEEKQFSSLTFRPDGSGWLVGLDGTLISVLASENGLKEGAFPTTELNLAQGINTSCVLAKEDSVWVGTIPGGLYRLNLKSGRLDHFQKKRTAEGFWIPGKRVAWLKEDETGRIWVGLHDNALALFMPKEQRFEKITYAKGDLLSKGFASPMSATFDRDGNVWLGSLNLGLFHIDLEPTLFRYEYLRASKGVDLSSSYINCYLEASNGTKWVGIRGVGLYGKTKGKQINIPFTATAGNRSIEVTHLAEDRYGRIWMGTGPGSVGIYDPKTERTVFIDDESLQNASVGALLVEDDNIWVGTENRVVSVDIDTLEIKHEITGITYQVRSLNIAPDGKIWIGSQSGIHIYDRDQERLLALNSNGAEETCLPTGRVSDVKFLKDGSAWVSSYGGGFRRFDKNYNLISTINVRDDLPSEAIGSFQIDETGIFWAVTRAGVLALDPETKKFEHFDVKDGLFGNRFEPRVSTVREDGTFAFPGTKGLLIVDPKYRRSEKTHLTPVFTGIKVLDSEPRIGDDDAPLKKAIGVADSLVLKNSERVFTLSYSAMNYNKLGHTWFRHRVVGMDQKWSEPTLERSTTFAHLWRGEHTLELMASNNPDQWQGGVRRLSVTVLPSIWVQWWFVLGAIVLSGTAIYGVTVLRTRHLSRRRKELEDLVASRTKTIEERNVEITKQNDELAKHRNHLELMVHERTSDLVEAKNNAEKADELKSAFLANMSHEIRTPLNAIVGFSQILANLERNDGGKRAGYAKVIKNSADGLTHLIDDILDISKLESAQLDVIIEEFDILDLCRSLHLEYEERTQEIGTNVAFKFMCSLRESITVKSDRYRTRQILVNFLDNALKFTKEGSVTLGISTDSNSAVISVADTGIGIAKEDQTEVFDRFRKLENKGNILFRGAGLGLAISHKLAELIDGKIELESELGNGATFSLRLPLVHGAVSTTKENLLNSKNEYNFSDLTIMVAEDEEDNYSLMEQILEPTNATVLRAIDGLDLVEQLEKGLVCDIVIMDIHMPRMNGIEALECIKCGFPATTVIAYTAHTLVHNRERVIKLGFDEYLSKPVDGDKVLDTLHRFSRRVS